MRLEEGRVPGCSLLSLPEGLRPPSLGAEKLTAFAKTRGLGLTDCGRPEAAPSPVERPGKKAGAQQDGWVWIVVLFFLFVAFLGTKKKAQPFTPLHLHLSRPEIQPQWLGKTETTVCLSPYNSGWVGRAFLLGPTQGSSYGSWPEHNPNKVNYRPPQPCTYFFAGFRLNTSDPIQFKIFF